MFCASEIFTIATLSLLTAKYKRYEYFGALGAMVFLLNIMKFYLDEHLLDCGMSYMEITTVFIIFIVLFVLINTKITDVLQILTRQAMYV
jgi:hypothetical protein